MLCHLPVLPLHPLPCRCSPSLPPTLAPDGSPWSPTNPASPLTGGSSHSPWGGPWPSPWRNLLASCCPPCSGAAPPSSPQPPPPDPPSPSLHPCLEDQGQAGLKNSTKNSSLLVIPFLLYLFFTPLVLQVFQQGGALPSLLAQTLPGLPQWGGGAPCGAGYRRGAGKECAYQESAQRRGADQEPVQRRGAGQLHPRAPQPQV